MDYKKVDEIVANRIREIKKDKRDIVVAHKFCCYNRKQLLKDKKCGCFYCLTIFDPAEINEWCDEGNTAICPYCGIDSIIGESLNFPITKEFLTEMQVYWF